MFLFLTKVHLANFADDNTLSTSSKNIKEILDILESESNQAIAWFRNNMMIVNPDKFQMIIFSTNKSITTETIKVNIDGIEITPTESVSLLGIEIDNKLSFEKHTKKTMYQSKQST